MINKEASVKGRNGKEIKLKKRPKSTKKIAKIESSDPLNDYGAGIVAYRDLLWNLVWVFVILTLITLPS